MPTTTINAARMVNFRIDEPYVELEAAVLQAMRRTDAALAEHHRTGQSSVTRGRLAKGAYQALLVNKAREHDIAIPMGIG